MNNDQQVIKKATASLAIQCKQGCGQTFYLAQKDFVRVKIADLPGVYESGLACPNCGTFYIAAYDSDALIAQRAELKRTRGVLRNALQRRYMIDFNSLQRDMAERERKAKEEKASVI